MSQLLKIIQLVLSIFLIIIILLQGKNAGFANLFGAGSSNVYATKRGAEKFLFYATIVLGIIFVISILADIFIK
jgi:protein translocase SecG subunit